MTPAENGKPPKAEGKTEANSAQAELRRQLVAQVSRGLIAAVVKREGAEGGGSAMGAPETLVLKLRPESLGHVKVMLEWKEADSGQPQPRLFARFEVQSKHTQEVLRNAINELRSSLESRGLSLDGAQVELSKPVMADPLRALGERPESTAHSWHQPATDTQGGLADPSGGFSHSGGNSGDGRNGLAGGWAAGWSPVPSGALDSAIAMVPDLLDAEPGSAVFAAANRFGAFTGIDTFA